MSNPLARIAPALAGALLVSAAGLPSIAAERSEIPQKYTWNLVDVYPSVEAWTAAKEQAIKRIPEMDRFKGHLGDSAGKLYEALQAVMDLDRDLGQVRFYASRLSDQDLRVSKNLEMLQSVEQALVQFRAATAYLRPEIIAMDPAKVKGFIASEPRLRPYAVFLDDILRRKPHTLSPEEEKVAARASDLAGAGDSIRSVFANADFPYPEVTLGSGEKVRLDAAAYTKYRAAADPADRRKVFDAFWTEYAKYERTFGATLYAQIRAHVFNRDVHKFGSSLEAALFEYNIPTSVYRQLLSDVHDSLPTLFRYLKLRKRMLGVERLGYEDLYAPIVKEVEATYTPEQAMDLFRAASAPLGKEYVDTISRGFAGRWVDFLPNPGKRSGAYSETAYGVHPYQLLNFMGQYEDVSTLAHEFGHSMHSFFSDRSQPYVTHDYSTFVAEVASTLNENLLYQYMLRDAKDDASRLSLLGNHLELLRTTIYRQTLFAEFELDIHEMAERGESLTGENLTKLYLELVRKYYGHDQGVCEVKDLYGVEWAYIPHFYWNFYVYQYATSLIASISIADGIVEEASKPGNPGTRRDAYLKMLSSGSSKYPIDLLKDVGVDMTTSKPFEAAMKHMNRVMDEMEAILDRKAERK